MSEGGSEQENPYKEPRKRFDVEDHFLREHHNPWTERVERPGMRDMVAVSTIWDRNYDMPVKEGTLFWGTVGEFWDLYHSVNRFASDEKRREDSDLSTTDTDR